MTRLLVNLLLPGYNKASLMSYDLNALGLNTCKDLEELLLARLADRYSRKELDMLCVDIRGWYVEKGIDQFFGIGSIVLEPSLPDSDWTKSFSLHSAFSGGKCYACKKDVDLHAVALEQGLTEIIEPLECKVEMPMQLIIRQVGQIKGTKMIDTIVAKPFDLVRDAKINIRALSRK